MLRNISRNGVFPSITTVQISQRHLNLLAGFKRQTKSDSNVSIAEKPQATGNGPFIQLPEFKPIGDPSKLLNITLPASSLLNIRNGSLVAIDGDIHQLSSTTRWLTERTDYEELRSRAPVSVVINGNQQNYSIVEIKDPKEKWYILKDDSITAWTGFNLQLQPSDIVGKATSYQTSGKGVVVVNSESQLFEVGLSSNEEMLVNPNALVATSSKIGFKVVGAGALLTTGDSFSYGSGIIQGFKASGKMIFKPFKPVGRAIRHYWPRELSFTIPSIGPYVTSTRSSISQSLRSFSVSSGIASTPIPIYWVAFKRYLSQAFASTVSSVFRNKPIYISVRGPGRLLINNNPVVSNSKYFTNSEIRLLYRKSQ